MNEQTGPAKRGPDASTLLAVERTYIAHERTLLAWIRTSTSLITFGFSIQQFFRLARAEPNGRLFGPQEFGLLMMIVGLAALALAVLEHRSDMQDLHARYPTEDGFPPGRPSRARMLAALIAVLGIAGVLSMTLR